MIRLLLLVAAALSIATPLGAQTPAPNPFDRRLSALAEVQRHAVLRRAVIDGGQRCKRVIAAARQGRYRNLMMWSARCAPGGDYGVFIGPDASVQIRPCADLVKLRLPVCRLPAKR